MRWWSFGPDEFAVFVTLSEYSYKARLSIEYAAFVVCVCDASVASSCVDSYAHLVFVDVSSPAMESSDSSGCTARYFVQARAL